MAFAIQPVLQISPVVDDIRLMDREDRIAMFERLLGNVAMTKKRNQFGRLSKYFPQPITSLPDLCGSFSPFRPPNSIVLDIEPKAFERPIKQALDRRWTIQEPIK